ncbi:hypothetical protein KSS87_013319 [Heliosperma pusillum]|nr:hypothetical protein KSS87_013319 [Heliosperma pusillum]
MSGDIASTSTVDNTFNLVESISTPLCLQDADVPAGNHLALSVTPGGSEEWQRNVAPKCTPSVGQLFCTIEECVAFYKSYALACGFEPRLSSTKRFRRNGDIKSKLIVCNREGFRDSKQAVLPPPVEEDEKKGKGYDPKKTKITRIGCKAKIYFKLIFKTIEKVQVPFFVVSLFHASHNHLLCKGVKKIPDKYLLSRWTKNTKKMPLYDVNGQLMDDFTASDVSKMHISTAWSEFYSTLTLLKAQPAPKVTELIHLLTTFRQQL